MSDTIVRNYHDDDIDELLRLYNTTPPGVPSFARNTEFLRHFIRYPGVKDSVFVAQKDCEIEGIAIVSIVETEGLIEGRLIELRAKDAFTMDLLVQRTLQYCCDRGVDVVFATPLTHNNEDRIFDGWMRFGSGIMLVKALYVMPILAALLNTSLVKKHYAKKNLIFNVDDVMIKVVVSTNQVQISELKQPVEDLAVMVTMSSKTFLEVVFGWTNPYIAYLGGRIRIRGLKNALAVLRILYSIRIKSPWHVAPVDEV